MALSRGPYVAWREEISKVQQRLEMLESGDDAMQRVTAELVEPHQDFSGATARNYFYVSDPIKLTGIYFEAHYTTGHVGSEASYVVEIEILRGIVFKEPTVTVYSGTRTCTSFGHGYMYVPFWIPTFIKLRQFYTVIFRLIGPETRLMMSTRDVFSVKIQDGVEIKFEFLKGSKQMSGLEFWMVPASEISAAHAQWSYEDEHTSTNDIGWVAWICECIADCFI